MKKLIINLIVCLVLAYLFGTLAAYFVSTKPEKEEWFLAFNYVFCSFIAIVGLISSLAVAFNYIINYFIKK